MNDKGKPDSKALSSNETAFPGLDRRRVQRGSIAESRERKLDCRHRSVQKLKNQTK
jgi:hypothetical protein